MYRKLRRTRAFSNDADGLVARGSRQSGGRSFLNGQHDQGDVVTTDVDQRSQQILHRRVLAFGPIGEEVTRRTRLLLGGTLLERRYSRRCVS